MCLSKLKIRRQWFNALKHNNVLQLEQYIEQYKSYYTDQQHSFLQKKGLSAIHLAILQNKIQCFKVIYKCEADCLTNCTVTKQLAKDITYTLAPSSNILHLAFYHNNIEIIEFIQQQINIEKFDNQISQILINSENKQPAEIYFACATETSYKYVNSNLMIILIEKLIRDQTASIFSIMSQYKNIKFLEYIVSNLNKFQLRLLFLLQYYTQVLFKLGMDNLPLEFQILITDMDQQLFVLTSNKEPPRLKNANVMKIMTRGRVSTSIFNESCVATHEDVFV